MRHSIILATDQNYVPHMATAIRSLVENNADLALNVHVINSDIGVEQWQRLERTIRGFDCRLIDTKVDAARTAGLATRYHITHASYFRLMAPDLIPAETALYLDCDLLVTGSIAGLFGTERTGKAVAAVGEPKYVPDPALGMDPGAKYFNSGVMWMDMDVWRAQNIGARVIDLIAERGDQLPYLDQCGLNSVINGAWAPLDPAHNVQSSFWMLDETDADAAYGPGGVARAIARPRILHYTGAPKPWSLRSTHPLRSLYWSYRRRTAFPLYLPEDITPGSVARKLLPDRLVDALRGR